MAVFKKQGVYWIDYYVNGRRKRERIGPDKRLAETVLKARRSPALAGSHKRRQTSLTRAPSEADDPAMGSGRW